MTDQLAPAPTQVTAVGTYAPPATPPRSQPPAPVPSRRRVRWILAALMVVTVASVILTSRSATHEIGMLSGAVVYSPVRIPGVVVMARRPVRILRGRERAHVGERVAVRVTQYCLQGTTRRGRWVRPGIVAADPRVFPLSRYIELFINGTYAGRFLVDDTGKRILGARIDVWEPSCKKAMRFGVQRGVAVLVGRASN